MSEPIPEFIYIVVELYDKSTTRYDINSGKLTSKTYPFALGVEKAGEMTTAMLDSVVGEGNVIAIDQFSHITYVRASDVRFVTVHYVPKSKT